MVQMRAVIAIVLVPMLGGCDQLFGLTHLAEDAGSATDGPPPDAACPGVGMLSNLCVESSSSVTLTAALDTTDDVRCREIPQVDGPALCVIDGASIVVSEHVQVTGTRPLVLLAATIVEIQQPLDASSKLGVRTGAGAAACASGNGAAGSGTGGGVGAGGGAGGTFGHMGGPGGAGQATTTLPAAGGAPGAVTPLTAVAGGCSGGDGGFVLGSAARGGPGGGAIYVIAGSQIHVAATGSINASGAGGAGGTSNNGGGGGGAGGFIALDAPSIVLDGEVFARGGGGGGGGGNTASAGPGAEPSNATAQTPGGAATAGGTGGGDGCGAPAGELGGFTAGATYGGGGGGGGCGRIRLYGTRTGTAAVNPAPT